jgi:hypothetical protein
LADKLLSRTHSITTKPAAHLAIIAGVSGLIYLAIFTLRFPLTAFYATIPPIDYAKLTNYSPGGLLIYVIGLGLLFGLYLYGVRLAAPAGDESDQPPVPASLVFLGSAVLAAGSILAYPLTAIDLFIYAIRTRGWALYGLNPLTTAPEQLPAGDPWLNLAGEWIDAASPYGPAWELLSRGAFTLSGGGFLAHLLALKLLAALAYLGCVWLVYDTLQQLRPEWATAGTLAFAWSPLTLLESVQNGHNDIVMSFFLLAASWVFVGWQLKGHRAQTIDPAVGTELPEQATRWLTTGLAPLFICVFLALSILIKFVTIVTLPFFLLGLVSRREDLIRRLASMAGYALLVALLVALPLLPFWPGLENWAVLQAGRQAGRSLLALLILGLSDPLGLNTAFDWSRNLILGLFGLIYLYLLGRTIVRLRHISARPEAERPGLAAPLPILPSFLALFWYVLLAAPVFHAWYLLWFLPLAALLLPARPPLAGAVVFSITALLIIPYFETIRVWYPALLRNQFIGHLVGVPLLILPPALALLWPISPGKKSEV